MTKLIIDPGLFEISESMSQDDQIEHFLFLKTTIMFAAKFFDAEIDEYNGAPYISFYDDSYPYKVAPLTKSHIIRIKYAELFKYIQKMLRNGKTVELNGETVDDCPLQFEEATVTTIPFKGYVYALLFNGTFDTSTFLLLLSQRNHGNAPTTTFGSRGTSFELASVSNPEADCNQIISKYLKESTDKNAIFPQKDSCFMLDSLIQSETSRRSLNIAEKRPLYIKYGYEVASRNGYSKQSELSKKNPKYKVFVDPSRNYYLSIDLEHGGLEIFKSQGSSATHLGEYNYSCIRQKGAEPETHRINL